jgi:hypothetical protein
MAFSTSDIKIQHPKEACVTGIRAWSCVLTVSRVYSLVSTVYLFKFIWLWAERDRSVSAYLSSVLTTRRTKIKLCQTRQDLFSGLNTIIYQYLWLECRIIKGSKYKLANFRKQVNFYLQSIPTSYNNMFKLLNRILQIFLFFSFIWRKQQ